MLSFFRRTPSAAPDSSNRDPKPPPSPGKRQQKEKAWLHSISSKSSRSGSSAQPASTRNTAPRRSDKAASNVAQQGFKPAPSLRPQPSSASLKSSATRRSFFGIKGKSSTEPAAEDQDRRRPTSTYAASAPSHLGASRSHSPPPPLPPSLPPPTTTDTTTKSLATRLQELSIANADGLLDDEEYRMLRTRLFETYATGAAGGDQENKSLLVEGREAVPRLGGGSNGASTSTLRAPTSSNTPPSSPPQSHRAPSLLSTTSSRRPSLNNLFRRGSASISNGKTGPTTSLSDDWDLVPETTNPDRSDVDSVLSGRSGRGLGSGGTGRSRVLSNVPESPTMASLSPSLVDSSPIRTRSARHHPALASAALSPRGEGGGRYGTGSSQGSGGGRGGTESLFSAGSDGGGGTARSSYSYSPSKTARGGGGSTTHSTSSRSIFPSSASSISQSISHSISSSSLLPPIPSSSDPFLFASVAKEPSSKELREEIEEIEGEWRRMAEMWRGLEGGAMERWEGRVGEGVARRVKEEEKRGREKKAAEEMQSEKEKTKGLRRASSFSLLSPSKPRRASTMTVTLASPLSPPSTLPSFFLNPTAPLPPSLQHQTEDNEHATQALREEVSEIARRRRTTEEKYEKRLEFLRAKMRGAVLKEGLRR